MAVDFDGFSIREYALKMRSVDYGKCWPFGDGVEGRRFFPDMPVRKFRWWADELQALRADSRTPEPARAGFDSEKNIRATELQAQLLAASKLLTKADEYGASVDEENGRQAKVCTPSRMKQRTPKKRSIVELFAVSPPMKTVNSKTDRSSEGPEDQKDGDEVDGEVEEEKEDTLDRLQEDQVAAKDSKLDAGDGDVVLSEKKSSKGRKKRINDDKLKSKKKIGIKKKITKKKKENKKKKKKIMKKDEKNKLVKVDINTEKGKTCKHRMSSAVNLSKVNKSLHNAEYSSMHTLLLSQIKNARVRKSNAEHILRLSRASKLTSKNQEVSRFCPAINLLKKHKRRLPAKKGKTKSVIEDSDLTDLTEFSCDPNKQLSYAGKDGKVGNKEKSKQLGLPNLRRLCKIISDAFAASSTLDDSCKPICATEADQLVNFHDKEVITRNIQSGEASLEGNQVNDTCEVIVGMKSGGTKKTHLSRSLDLNYPVQNYVDLTCFSFDNSSCAPSTEIYESNPKVPDLLNKAVASVGCENLAKPIYSFMPDFGKRIENASAKCTFVSFPEVSTDHTRNKSLHQLPSCLDKRMDSIESQYNHTMRAKNVSNNVSKIQPAYHIPPKDIVSSINSSSLGESRVPLDLASFCTRKSIEEGFVGLPLNSQGAFMQLHPNTSLDYGDLHMRSKPAPDCLRLLSPSYHIEPHTEEQGKYIQLYKKDHQNWFSKQYFPGGNILTSDIGSSELHGLGKFNVQTHDAQSQFADQDFRMMGTSYNGRKNGSFNESGFDKMKFHSEIDQYFQPSLQRSVRLMGKNVIIGRISKDSKEFYDGNIWKDKDIINQKIPTMNAYNGHIMNRYPQGECILHPHFLLSREGLSSTLEAQSMCTCVPSIGKTSDYIHFNILPQRMSKDGNCSATKYQGLHTGASGGHVPLQNFRTDFTFDRNSPSSFFDLEQPNSVGASSYPEKISRNMLLSSIPCERGQNGYSKHSLFNQPLLDQVSWSFGQAGTAHSSQSVPHWLLNPINQHPVVSNRPANVRPPYTVTSNIRFPAVPSRRPVTVFPCSSNRISQTCSFPAPTSSVYDSSFAAMAASSFPSINPSQNNKTGNKAVELNFSHVNMQDHYRNSLKRPLVQNDIVKKTVKRRDLKVHKESPVFTDPARSGQWKDVERNKRAQRSSIMQPSHPLMQKDKDGIAASSESCALTADCERSGMTVSAGIEHKDSLETSSGPCPTNSSAQTTSGPVKLSAGAKHILRPSQSMDQDNSRPVHSMIPFVQQTSIDDGSPIQTATQVYRF